MVKEIDQAKSEIGVFVDRLANAKTGLVEDFSPSSG